MSTCTGKTLEVRSDEVGDVSLRARGGPSSTVWMSREDALQVAYALMAVCAGQGPSLVRVHRGRRERAD